MWENIKFIAGFIAFVAGIFSLVISLAISLAYFSVAYSCNGYERATGKETKMYAFECYVKDQEQWFVWEEYKYRLVTKGEFSSKE
jgi:hypothetical protein